VVVEARRQVIEHCLYGVDINPMAVEMAKLSLWLVSMDPQRPFTFLDDRLVAGDSLLGITSLDQLEYLHMDPKRGRELHEDIFGWTSGVRSLVAEIAAERRQIATIEPGDNPLAALARKRSLLASAERRAGPLRLFADLAVGAALAYAGRGDRGLAAGSIEAARLINDVASGRGEPAAREQRKAWLATDQVDGTFDREPLHWPLAFPEVFECGGFHAVIGNPPFLGGTKLLPVVGQSYRDHLVHNLGRGVKGVRGTADLVAYFALRAYELVDSCGQLGLVATNTLAQGDSRSVGLDQLVANGVTIRRSVKSEAWPSRSAALEYCVVWITRCALGKSVKRFADGVEVDAIGSSLDSESRVTGGAKRLQANTGRCIQGVKIWGAGFTLTPETAAELIDNDPRNREVLFPYLVGQDLNSRPDCSASRWVIDFSNWPESRARDYPACYRQIVRAVKPERERVRFRKQVREIWWQFAERRPELLKTIAGLERVVVLAQTSRTVAPALVDSNQVFDQKIIVFTTDDPAMLALIGSNVHYWWAVSRSSTMKTDLSYTPTATFETLVRPLVSTGMRDLGTYLDTYRRKVMLSRHAGLTKTYNLVHDPACTDSDIVELRAIHTAIDEATVRAYGWDDLLDQLDHGFHPVGRETRYTIGPAAQREILDRLLELNHQRYAEEVAAGLHDKGKKRATAPARKTGDDQGTLL
jgi:hypothetical protein